ncbi:MAG: 23S rRNA (pseudouridine(1915)-N(3))-methyltransferase RlmH [Alphaproteobacteria bacterium]
MKIQIIAIGKVKKGAIESLFSQYAKRIKRWKLEVKEFAESQAQTGDARKLDEAEKILSQIKPGCIIVALDERGEHLTSPEMANFMAAQENASASYISFIIGGPDGLDDTIRAQAKSVWALGRATWPHQLVRALLAEQIYRSQTIIEGHPYHRS